MSAAALYQLGPIQFTVAPLNVHAVVRESNTDFAEKPIIGSSEPPPLEYVGEGAEVMTFQGRLFPKQFGGLKGLEALQKNEGERCVLQTDARRRNAIWMV
jgi:phage protein U